MQSSNPKLDGLCRSCYERQRSRLRRCDPIEREKFRQYYKHVYKTRPDVQRRLKNANLQRHFGITIEEYEELVRKQNNACALCKRPPNEKQLSVDHVHDATKRIRGLLCQACNYNIVGTLEKLNVSPTELAAYLN